MVKDMATSLRAVKELQSPALRDRHWHQLMTAIGVSFLSLVKRNIFVIVKCYSLVYIIHLSNQSTNCSGHMGEVKLLEKRGWTDWTCTDSSFSPLLWTKCIPGEFICRSLNSQGDDIWGGGLWEVIGSWRWSPSEWIMGLVPLSIIIKG